MKMSVDLLSLESKSIWRVQAILVIKDDLTKAPVPNYYLSPIIMPNFKRFKQPYIINILRN